MRISRTLGLLVGLGLSIVALAFLLFAVAVTSSGPGHPTGLSSALGITIACLPFVVTFWIVYRSFCTDDMATLEILGCTVRPRALLRAFLAELAVCVGIGTGYVLLLAK